MDRAWEGASRGSRSSSACVAAPCVRGWERREGARARAPERSISDRRDSIADLRDGERADQPDDWMRGGRWPCEDRGRGE